MGEPIKPCPFCGGMPKKERIGLSEVYAYADKVIYQCMGCGVTRGAMGDTSKGGYADNSTVEARALESWNARYPVHDLSIRQDAERFRFIQQDADSGMRRIYGDDWLAVIDAGGFQAIPDNGPRPNRGHGHVFPRADGVRARCGGPKICKECAIDQARKDKSK